MERLYLQQPFPPLEFEVWKKMRNEIGFYELLCEDTKHSYYVNPISTGGHYLLKPGPYESTVAECVENGFVLRNDYEKWQDKLGALEIPSAETIDTAAGMLKAAKVYHGEGIVHGNLADLKSYGVHRIRTKKVSHWRRNIRIVLLDRVDCEKKSAEKDLTDLVKALKEMFKTAKKAPKEKGSKTTKAKKGSKTTKAKKGSKTTKSAPENKTVNSTSTTTSAESKEVEGPTDFYMKSWLDSLDSVAVKGYKYLWFVSTHPTLWSWQTRRDFFENLWLEYQNLDKKTVTTQERKIDQEKIRKAILSITDCKNWRAKVTCGTLKKVLESQEFPNDFSDDAFGLYKFVRVVFRHVAEKVKGGSYKYIVKGDECYVKAQFVEMQMTRLFPTLLPGIYLQLIELEVALS